MSLSKLEEIICPCGENFEAELWNSIDVARDADLKEALLSGEINIVCCPMCHQIFYAEHFILYHDSRNELIAFVYPGSFASDKKHWEKTMAEDFKSAVENLPADEKIDYKPVLLFGLDALVKLIQDTDETVDECKILEYIAEDIGVDLVFLHHYRARCEGLPCALPLSGQKHAGSRKAVIEGLKKLLKENPNLEVFKALLDTIEKDSGWVLDEELIKTKRKKGHK